MANRFSKEILAVAILVVATAILAQDSSAPADEEPDEITRQKLETIQQEIATLRETANQLSAQENTILKTLSQYDIESQMKVQEIQLLELRQKKTEGAIEKLQTQYSQLQSNMEKQKQYLMQRLVEAYKLGELNYLKLMLRVNQSADLLRSYQYITFLAKDDTKKVQRYRESLVDLDQTRLRLEQENRNLAQLKADLVSVHAALQFSREEKRKLLNSIRDEKSMHLSALSDLRVASIQLQQFFAQVDPSVLAPLPSGVNLSIVKQKGALDWPVSGRILRNFGTYRHPRFATTTMCNGIEIAAPEGSDVRAVYDGQVVFAEWFKGYGKSVILSHSDGYYTLYAHNSDLLVQRGQTVTRAQAIARVGSTGALEGIPKLYFEIRHRDEPLNPLDWLRR